MFTKTPWGNINDLHSLLQNQHLKIKFTMKLKNFHFQSCSFKTKIAKFSQILTTNQKTPSPLGRGCRIHRILLCKEVRTPPQPVSLYDTKQSDGEAPVMLELWGVQSTPSLLSLPGPPWPVVVEPLRFISIGQIELNCVLMLNGIALNRTVLTLKLFWYSTELFKWNCFCMLNCMLNWIALNRTVLTLKLFWHSTELFEMELFLYAKLNCLVWNCCWHWNCSYAIPNCLKSNCFDI